MNFLDVLVMAFFGGIVMLAFIGGLGRVFSALVGMYFGIIVAALFYRPVAVLAQRVVPTMSMSTGELVMFVLLTFLFSLGFGAALARTFVLRKLPRWLGVFSNISGAVLGILVAVVGTVLAAIVISLSLQALARTADTSSSGFLLVLQRQMQTSALVPIFLKLAPAFITPLKPWFPRGLPPILAPENF